jgi:hypothetical protein
LHWPRLKLKLVRKAVVMQAWIEETGQKMIRGEVKTK